MDGRAWRGYRARGRHLQAAFELFVAYVEGVVHEGYHLAHVVDGIGAAVNHVDIARDAVVSLDKTSGYHLLILESGFALRVGHHVVDILDEHYSRIDIVEILDESAVTAGTEEELAVLAERGVVGIGGNGVGRFFCSERYVVVHAEGFFKSGHGGGNLPFEESAVFGRHGKVEVDVSILVGGSLGAFHEVFLQRCARTLGIGVEFEQTLGELSVAEALLVEQGRRQSPLVRPSALRAAMSLS